jgi:hypothetical protein
MHQDPIVEEIHRIRQAIARDCRFDLHELMERLRREEEKHPGVVVSTLDEPVRRPREIEGQP